MGTGFEKMDHGLSENFVDRVSPIKQHVESLEKLGAKSGPLNPHVNAVTSDVIKASGWGRIYYTLRIPVTLLSYMRSRQ